MLEKKYIKVAVILLASTILTGCMETMFVGTAGTVVELAKDRPAGDAMTDVRIATGIKAEFIKNNFRELYTKIKVEVVQGRVLFTGSINNEQDAINAVQIAWSQKGVVEVINELRVDKNSNTFDLVQYTRDTMITSQIKSKLFMNREVKFVNYTVITLNDVVYLFGIARSDGELEQVASIASNVHGVKKVVSHARVHELSEKVQPKDMTKRGDNSENLLIDKDADDLSLDEGIGDDW